MEVQVTYPPDNDKTSQVFKYAGTICRRKYYYDAIEITVTKADSYTIISNSTMEMSLTLHKNNFHILDPRQDIILDNVYSLDAKLFITVIHLQANTRYILVLNNNKLSMAGSFLVHVFGRHNISLNRASKCLEFFGYDE